MCLLQSKIACPGIPSRGATGEPLRTTAVTSSVQAEFAIPKVSDFLRPSQFPRCPAPLLVRRDLVAAIPWSLTFYRNRRARPAWSSTAMTRAPASSNGRVRAPTPAPRSTTSSPGRMAALATIRSAQSGSSRCQPHGRRPDTTHHEDHRHDPKASGPASPPRGNFQPRPARR
jgi:hypothetical protein